VRLAARRVEEVTLRQVQMLVALAAFSIANPYWNNAPQGLFDPRASYIAYNQLPGTGLSSVSSSYIVPHVATLLLNGRPDTGMSALLPWLL